MYIILAILMFGILIAIHEFGHFSAAKGLGVKVNEFSIGMGPAILKRQRGETLYALRCLPIGGYCAMEGEDEATDDPRCFAVQPLWKRFIILVAGSAMNFLLGLLLLVVFFCVIGVSKPMISGFMDGCPYEGQDAFLVGDTIYSIDGHRIHITDDVSVYLSRGGDTHDIVVLRDGEKVLLDDLTLTTHVYTVDGEETLKYGFTFTKLNTTVPNVLNHAWYGSLNFVRQVWYALTDLVRGVVGFDQLSGPVGIVNMINEVGQTAEQQGIGVGLILLNIAYFAAFIAVNLAVMNLLPLPALDGGRIFFLFVGGIVHLFTKRRLDPKYEGYVHAVGMVLLLGLMAFVMYNDIARIITG